MQQRLEVFNSNINPKNTEIVFELGADKITNSNYNSNQRLLMAMVFVQLIDQLKLRHHNCVTTENKLSLTWQQLDI